MPKGSEKLADWLTRYDQWRQARKLQRRPAPPTDADGMDWDTRGKRALAMKREHELEVQQGKFLPREQVVAEWTRRVFTVRQRLLALPRSLAARCANAPADQVERAADEIVRDALLEFSADGEQTPAPEAAE